MKTSQNSTAAGAGQLRPARLLLGYAVGASLLLGLTTLLPAAAGDGRGSWLLQGLIFIAASSLVLFLMLTQVARRADAQRRNLDATARAYRLLFERHPLPSWVCEPEHGEILAANAAAQQLEDRGSDHQGRRLADILGRDPDDASTLVQAGDHSERAYRLLSTPCTFEDRPALLYLAQDLTEDRAALARAHRYTEEMRLLTRRLLNAQEQERRAIARQLHDQLGQTLTVARLLVESTLDQIEDPEVNDMLREAMAALEIGLNETRTLTGSLRPPMLDDLGIVPTLRWLVDRSTAGSGIRIHLDLPPDPGPLVSEIDVAIYRIAQEAIANALQHGNPGRLHLRLRLRQTVITLSIEDDGRGFDPSHVLAGLVPFGRSGLLGARERAEALGGGVRVRSQPGQGTIVRAMLPRQPRRRAATS